jgi:hypothetical protein
MSLYGVTGLLVAWPMMWQVRDRVSVMVRMMWQVRDRVSVMVRFRVSVRVRVRIGFKPKSIDHGKKCP